MKPRLRCDCGATAADNSKERGHFRRRHPVLCKSRKTDREFTRALADRIKSVNADAPTEFEGRQV